MAIVYHGREVTVLPQRDATTPATPCRTRRRRSARQAIVLFGRRHLEAGDPEHSFAGRIKDARIYDQAAGSRNHRRPAARARSPATSKPWAWWSFADEGLREKTGRFTEIKLIGDVRIDDGCLVLGGKGATVITTCSGGDGGEARFPFRRPGRSPARSPMRSSARRGCCASGSSPIRIARATTSACRRTWACPAIPTARSTHNGRYHLMYLYNRNGSGFCWGHISSGDLVHWRHHPDAIGPGQGDEGCFSGGAFVDDDGTAYLSYWMLWGAKGIGLAKSRGPDFDAWTKLPTPTRSSNPPSGASPRPRTRTGRPSSTVPPTRRTSGRRTAATTCSPATCWC